MSVGFVPPAVRCHLCPSHSGSAAGVFLVFDSLLPMVLSRPSSCPSLDSLLQVGSLSTVVQSPAVKCPRPSPVSSHSEFACLLSSSCTALGIFLREVCYQIFFFFFFLCPVVLRSGSCVNLFSSVCQWFSFQSISVSIVGLSRGKVCSPEMMSSCSIPIGFVFDVVVRSMTCELFRAVIFCSLYEGRVLVLPSIAFDLNTSSAMLLFARISEIYSDSGFVLMTVQPSAVARSFDW